MAGGCENNMKIKSYTIKRILAAIVIVGLLFNLDGVRDLGVLKAMAYDDLDYRDHTVSSEADNTKIAFFLFKDDAEEALADFNGTISDRSNASISGWLSIGDSTDVPANIGSHYVEGWQYVDKKTVSLDQGGSGQTTLVAYVAVFRMSYLFRNGMGQAMITDTECTFDNADQTHSVSMRSSDAYTRDGYTISGWKDDNSGNVYENDEVLDIVTIDSMEGSFTAVWERKPVTVDIYYGPNGVPGDSITQTEEVTITEDSGTAIVKLLDSANFVNPNYKLTGWLINEDKYGLGDDFQVNIHSGSTYEVYSFGAVWTPKNASSISINVADKVYDNDDIADKIETHPSRSGPITLEYKGADQEDSEYTTTEPSTPGDYIVRATLEETDDDASAFDTAPLTVLSSKLDVRVTYGPGAGNGTAINKDVEVTLSGGKGKLTLLTDADFERQGYRLTGWSGDGKTYDLGDEVEVDADTDSLAFEAVWTAKKEATINLEVDSPVKYGKDTEDFIIFSTDSDGKIKLEYKKSGASDSSYSEDVPSEIGKYVVRATVPETDEYLGATAEKDFEIALIQKDTEIKIDIKTPINYGTDVTSAITVTTNSDGKVKLEYKKAGEADSTYSDTTPKDAGQYVVRASVEATNDYKAASAEKSFEIISNQKETEITIEIKTPVYLGTDIEKAISHKTESNGDVTMEYKKKGASDDKYSKTVPKEIGKYVVRVSTESTAEYKAAFKEKEFEIVFLPAPDPAYSYEEIKDTKGAVTDLYVVPAEGYSIALSTDVPYGSKALYSAAMKAGVVYLQKDKDGAKTDGIKLSPYYLEDTVKLDVPARIYYGLELNVTASSLSPAEKKLEYKSAGAPDNAYSTAVPTKIGDYVVRFSVPASGLYAAVNETRNFSIVYLEAPSEKAYVDGKEGNDKWIIADVKIKAPDGYLISTSPGTGYKDSLDWDDGIRVLYYQKNDGAMTDGVEFDPNAKIDMKAPTVRFESSLGIKNPEGTVGLTLNSVTFTIEDENLKSVTVNGKSYNVSNKKCEITLEAGTETTQWTVVATDKAGNSYTFTIELSAQWMIDGIMPAGIFVSLKANVPYYFEGNGEWIVEAGGVEDKTAYTGGSKFYVKADKEYKFRLK